MKPHVAIILAVKDGAEFLQEQLQSYSSQTHQNWSLHMSDDGSRDDSFKLVQAFAQRVPQTVTLRPGPEKGPCRNFLSLLQAANIDADYFAFSDQDDIWHARKLERALNALQSIDGDSASLYCSRTELIDDRGQHIGYSPAFTKPPGFRNALVQNIGGGNTMVFNRRARELLMKLGDQEAVAHDWLTYIVISATGGTVVYDPHPSVRYRQHAENFVGSNLSMRAKMTRMGMLLQGQWRSWNSANLKILENLGPNIAKTNAETLSNFVKLRSETRLPQRMRYLWKSGVYRQTFVGNVALLFATLTKNV